MIRNRTPSVAANEVVVLRSGDGWRSAGIASRLARDDTCPVTATRRGNHILTPTTRLHLLGELLRDRPCQFQQEFQIRQVGVVNPRRFLGLCARVGHRT